MPVGVDEFGQSGSIPELYGVFDLLPEQIVNAALVAPSVNLTRSGWERADPVDRRAHDVAGAEELSPGAGRRRRVCR